jgi:hypothetical protein
MRIYEKKHKNAMVVVFSLTYLLGAQGWWQCGAAPAKRSHNPPHRLSIIILSLWVQELVIVFQNPINTIAPSPSSPSSTCCRCNSTIFLHHFLQLVWYCNSAIFLHHLLQLVCCCNSTPAEYGSCMRRHPNNNPFCVGFFFLKSIECVVGVDKSRVEREREREREREKRSDKIRPV